MNTLSGERVAPSRTLDPEIARSWLLVNGARTDLFDAADRSRADQMILDIEGAVDRDGNRRPATPPSSGSRLAGGPGCASTTGRAPSGGMTSRA